MTLATPQPGAATPQSPDRDACHARARQGLGALLRDAMRAVGAAETVARVIPDPSGEALRGADEPLRVLIVDADPATRHDLAVLLSDAGYRVCEAGSGEQGFVMALEQRPHIIVTEWGLPGMDGLGMTRALRQTKLGRGIYLLILTAHETDAHLVEAFAAGVDDYLSKPFNPRVLGARLRAARRVVLLQQEVAHDRDEIRRYADELARANCRLREAALTDVLTGLPNRRHAIEFLEHEWKVASRGKRPLTAMLIDVDRFKEINDSHGHDVGDHVLKRVAQAIKSGLRGQDVVCRTGGDEFTVICPDTDLAAGLVCAERVRKAVAALGPADGGMPLASSVSIGVAVRDAAMADIDALLKRADEGVYLAKQLGRNCVATIQSTTVHKKTD